MISGTEPVSSMRQLATSLLASEAGERSQRLRGTLDDPRLREWTYLPGDRPGLCLDELSAEQRTLVDGLIAAAHGEWGTERVQGAISVEHGRRVGAGADPDVGDRYWVRILGDPAEPVWAWRLNGHHLAMHVFVVDEAVTLTPHFLGAEPALSETGKLAGQRLLGLEEDLARELVTALDDEQRGVAVVADRAPDDILTRYDPVADPALVPAGLARGDMDDQQRSLLDRLVRTYLQRATPSYAHTCWQDVTDSGPEAITFAWAGPVEPGAGLYYSVRSPTFLLEYDNTQDDANHAHSVWRHLRDDWGGDPLRDHYLRSHNGS